LEIFVPDWSAPLPVVALTGSGAVRTAEGRLMTVEEIFLVAVEKPPGERAAYLDAACAGNPELRSQVDALVRSHEQAGSLLEKSLFRSAPTIDHVSPAEEPGAVIGPYKLLQQIGEGGMGAVWMAQQTEPVKRLVAVKLIKAGMDSRQVIARFEAERQALALMDHPNIARVLDAGTTDAGRPYFVMDLVKGVPITKYCDEHHLTPRQRLELFIPVCQAVQHAHQKGIIHRDLKPSNVLVALYDGRPVPKVIDFGVAKAAGQSLTDKTLVTGFGAILGTLEYMSPEQAEVNQLDIDTRSDIYSLGVLLYELLTGSPPFTRKDLEKAGMLEMLRVIREQEPSKPSTKLSTAEGLPTLAANRGTEPAKLTKLVRGELDWIVMKALEKDRNRRYESANGFAIDVQRYLADEPVQACPPSTWYRFRKFTRRNRGRLTVVAALGLALLIAIGGIGWSARDRMARRATAEQQRLGRQERLTAKVEPLLADVERLKQEQQWSVALAAAQRADAALASGEADEGTQQRVRDVLRDLTFVVHLDHIRLGHATMPAPGQIYFPDSRAIQEYAQAFHEYGVDVEQLPVAMAINRLTALSVPTPPVIAALDNWAEARRRKFGMDDPGWKSLVAIERGINKDPMREQIWDGLGQPVTPELQTRLRRLAESIDVRTQSPQTLIMLARLLVSAQLADSAIQILQDGQYAHPGDYWLSSELGNQLSRKGDTEAIRYLSVAVAIRPDSVTAHYNLGFTLDRQGKAKEAAACFRKVIELDSAHVSARYALGRILRNLKKPDEAVDCFRKCIELAPNSALGHHGLGSVLYDQKKLDEAIDCQRKAIELEPKWPTPHLLLGCALIDQKKLDDGIASIRKSIALNASYYLAYAWLGTALDKKGETEEAIGAWREAVRLKPNSAGFRTLATVYAATGRWDKAVADCDRALELEPENAQGGYLAALCHAGAGNVESYLRVCREMLKRFGGTNTVQAAERTASACLLLPDRFAADDLGRIQKLADGAVTGTEKDADYRYYAVVKGLATYRRGRHQEAVEWLQRCSPRAAEEHWDASLFAVLAMAQHRLGHPEEARSALSRAQTVLATNRPDPKQGRPYATPHTQRWLYSQLLCREAEALVGKKGAK
jgi:serine/threonine protein kinase/tetratricopeptide (TPR) repeat protein